ncbi:MAG: dihydroorotate dehydrogenase electron transfer subunit [Lachnospiraceae bacterium]|nr:dihydroorotate dehydrogenase electron transfer subunit [Lachnospiraceae bacterium]
MTKATGIVLSQDHIAEDIFSMRVGCGAIARTALCGQFVTVYCKDRSRLLPRPISICDADRERGIIRLVYRAVGAGTQEFSRYQPADSIEIMGPLGNGYPVEKAEGKEVWLMGGGIGIPPLLFLAKELAEGRDDGSRIHAILGYKDSLYLNGDFENIPGVHVHIATEDGSAGKAGNVMDARPDTRPGVIFACGPTPMLKAIRTYALTEQIPCYLSLEQRMACGVGACLACVCRSVEKDGHSQVANKRVCKEGPVFEAGEILL